MWPARLHPESAEPDSCQCWARRQRAKRENSFGVLYLLHNSHAYRLRRGVVCVCCPHAHTLRHRTHREVATDVDNAPITKTRSAVVNEDTVFLTLMADLLTEQGYNIILCKESNTAYGIIKK